MHNTRSCFKEPCVRGQGLWLGAAKNECYAGTKERNQIIPENPEWTFRRDAWTEYDSTLDEVGEWNVCKSIGLWEGLCLAECKWLIGCGGDWTELRTLSGQGTDLTSITCHTKALLPYSASSRCHRIVSYMKMTRSGSCFAHAILRPVSIWGWFGAEWVSSQTRVGAVPVVQWEMKKCCGSTERLGKVLVKTEAILKDRRITLSKKKYFCQSIPIT